MIFHCRYTPCLLYLFISWIISTRWLLWITLLWPFMYKYLFESLFSLILDIDLEVDLLGLTVIICLTFFKNLFIYLFLAALGLRCCVQAFSSCGKRGLFFLAVPSLLIAVASLCCRAQALGACASVVVALGLSCSSACGIFPDQGSNPCSLHWQVDS